MAKLTKSDLISTVSDGTGFTKTDTGKVIDAIFGAIKSGLANGDSISVIGFGTFSVGERSAREGRNPSTGEKIQIAAAKVPKFKAGKDLKESVNS